MLMSGVVKLTSGDDSWWNLTALDYHYWTQPLPTVFGWWAHQAPEWFGNFPLSLSCSSRASSRFFIWAPRRVRHIACALFVLLQLLIALTGNYCFFNLLTIALCLLLIDDAFWLRKRLVGRDSVEPSPLAPLSGSLGSTESRPTIWTYGRRVITISALLVLLPLNAMLIFSAFKPQNRLAPSDRNAG